MSETAVDIELEKYNVMLPGNRGKTVMKLNARDAERRGLTDADLVDPPSKSKSPSNKAKSAPAK